MGNSTQAVRSSFFCCRNRRNFEELWGCDDQSSEERTEAFYNEHEVDYERGGKNIGVGSDRGRKGKDTSILQSASEAALCELTASAMTFKARDFFLDEADRSFLSFQISRGNDHSPNCLM